MGHSDPLEARLDSHAIPAAPEVCNNEMWCTQAPRLLQEQAGVRHCKRTSYARTNYAAYSLLHESIEFGMPDSTYLIEFVRSLQE